MAFTHTITRSYRDSSGTAITGTDTITDNTEWNLDYAVPANQTNLEIDWSMVRADVKSLLIYSDQAISIYSNHASGSSPDDTVTLIAGQARVWALASDGIGAIPMNGDSSTHVVTKLFVTNTLACNLKIRALAHL